MFWYMLIAFLLGAIGMFIVSRPAKDGTLVIYVPDHEDESPYPVAEFNKPLQMICKKKHIYFDVDVREIKLNSQK